MATEWREANVNRAATPVNHTHAQTWYFSNFVVGQGLFVSTLL